MELRPTPRATSMW